jgi:GNAT superfamily N-acetyltransferase
MPGETYRDEPLRGHDCASFSGGVEPLDAYFRQQASQDQRRMIAAPHVLVEEVSGTIVGYYTLGAFAIRATSLPPDLTRRLPRYEVYPAILIGRLAVDRRFRGQGLGRRLLAAALRRCLALSEQLGAVAVVVDAKDDSARRFYEHAGFLRLADHEYRLYLPMRSAAQAVGPTAGGPG